MKAEAVRFLHRTVLVRRDEQIEATAGGIILPAVARELPNIGRVMAVGTGVTTLKAGDTVLFRKYHDRKLYLPGEEEPYLWFQEDEPYAVIEV